MILPYDANPRPDGIFGKDRGATFFNGYGQETKLMWQALLSALNRIEPFSEEGRQAVEAALDTFRMFRRGLAVASDPNG